MEFYKLSIDIAIVQEQSFISSAKLEQSLQHYITLVNDEFVLSYGY